MVSAGTAESEPKLRVLQAGSTAYRGGVTNAIKAICVGLRRSGHEVALITDGGDLTDLEALGISCHVTSLWQDPKSLAQGSWRFHRVIKAFEPNVVHVHSRATALLSLLSGRRADWFTLHNTHLTHRVGFYDIGWLRRHLSPWGRNFFVLDALAAQYLRKEFGIRESAITQVQNGIDCIKYREPTEDERFAARQQFGVNPDDAFVVFVGRLHPSKQPLAVVDAAARALADGRQGLRFAIVGDGELSGAVRDAIRDKGVEPLCSLYSWMEPLTAYFAADLVVMPSLFEGYGLVAAEAISTGCPVLRSRTGGSSLMIEEGVSGFECGVEADDFIEQLFRLLEDTERLRGMRAGTRQFALAKLDLRAATEAISAAYYTDLSAR